MPTYRLQTSLQDQSGLPRDQYVTTMYIAFPTAPSPADIQSACVAPSNFFIALRPYMSPTVDITTHNTKAYLLGAPLGTGPAGNYPWSFPIAPGGTALPAEVACCLSYHGSPQAGVRRQSWRGRMYIGPLNTTAAQSSSPGGRPDVEFRQDCVDAAIIMANTLNELGTWVVSSKVLETVFPVATCSMDDSWDTQRSRGDRPTSRVVGTVPGGGGASGPW